MFKTELLNNLHHVSFTKTTVFHCYAAKTICRVSYTLKADRGREKVFPELMPREDFLPGWGPVHCLVNGDIWSSNSPNFMHDRNSIIRPDSPQPAKSPEKNSSPFEFNFMFMKRCKNSSTVFKFWQINLRVILHFCSHFLYFFTLKFASLSYIWKVLYRFHARSCICRCYQAMCLLFAVQTDKLIYIHRITGLEHNTSYSIDAVTENCEGVSNASEMSFCETLEIGESSSSCWWDCEADATGWLPETDHEVTGEVTNDISLTQQVCMYLILPKYTSIS